MSSATATATATATSSGSCCPPPAPTPKEMVFYYRSRVAGQPDVSNFSEFINLTDPVTYSGGSTNWCYNISDGSVNKDQVITYIAFRIPPSESLELPAFYNETFNLNVKPFRDNYVQAVSTYEDAGTGNITTVPSNIFAVTTGIGMFKDAKTILIEYDNDNNTRKVIVRNY